VDWKETTLGELVHIKHGWAFKGEFFAEDGEKIVVTPGNFFEEGGFRLREGKEKFYTDTFPTEYLLKENDLIVAMTEQGEGLLGSPALVPANNKFLHNQRIGLFQKFDEKLVLKEYLYYLFFTEYIRKTVANTSTGTKVRHTSPKSLYKLKVKLPPLKTQKKIASILSNYDKLIENNNQRIKLLESMAEEIYKEWFVRLRFPDTKIKEINIGEIVDLRQGFALNSKSKHYISEQGIPLLKISDLFKGTETLFVNDSIPKQFLVNEDEIIYTRTAQVGYVFMGKKGVIYNNCFKVIPKNSLYTTFIYYFLRLKSTRYLAQTLATGTAQADLNHDSFKGIKINYPNEKIVIKFNKIVEPMDKEIKNLLIKNKNLKETRDLLLPKLIHGTLKV